MRLLLLKYKEVHAAIAAPRVSFAEKCEITSLYLPSSSFASPKSSLRTSLSSSTSLFSSPSSLQFAKCSSGSSMLKCFGVRFLRGQRLMTWWLSDNRMFSALLLLCLELIIIGFKTQERTKSKILANF